MKLSETEQSSLLNNFPNVELSYETMVHKKVYSSDFVLAIPEGRKYFAWFTTFKTQNVCLLLEITENKQICRIEIVNTCFHDQLSYGTIFYGTVFKSKNVKFFCTEDIYYYKGKMIEIHLYHIKIWKKVLHFRILELSGITIITYSKLIQNLKLCYF